MQTVTVDIFDDEGMKVLQSLELKKVLHIHREEEFVIQKTNPIAKYKGKMTKQPIEEVDRQLAELRNSWE